MENNNINKQNIFQVVMNDTQLRNIIINNIVKMFYNRHIIDKQNIDIYTNNAINNFNEIDETTINLNEEETKKLQLNKIHIKFLYRKITTIRKVIDIEDFLEKPEYKIIVVTQITPKADKQIFEYKNTERFYNNQLLINLIDHILIPKHIKLNDTEKELLKDSYNLKEKNIKRMFIDDPVSRYYNYKIGDIIRIERPSINSGIAIDYRIVIDGSIYK
jgi:DNA-directed RNA polymerase subunit H (RpoH/RPB5)